MIRKHSVTIRGHRTSFSLEDEFWNALLTLSDSSNRPLAALIADIDENRSPEDNLSSAIRVYLLEWAASQPGRLSP